MTFDALGYLRKDVSRQRQQWDEAQIRALARRLGYNLRKTITFGEHTTDPVRQLTAAVTHMAADAIIVPSIDHFDDNMVPADLVRIADVITIAPERTYARWPTGELPHLDGT
ncbi:hypothetical protein [Nocardia wallacei]|uniref:hypothetical protein n=1 Tax=Nocardia wallacei TaxID=480035 RepID=UPI00245400E0|nr:hypothetical protein [Nocardia wallacei]